MTTLMRDTIVVTPLNDINAALASALAECDIAYLDADDTKRVLDKLVADERFEALMTDVVHRIAGSPLDRGDFSDGRSCSDYALAIVRQILWRS